MSNKKPIPPIHPFDAAELGRYACGKIPSLNLDSLHDDSPLAHQLAAVLIQADALARANSTDPTAAKADALIDAVRDRSDGPAVITAIYVGNTSALTEDVPTSRRTVTLQDVADAAPQINWVWEPWVARGYLSVLVGEPGIGKTNIAMRLAGSCITGMPWPDGTPAPSQHSRILWIDTEQGRTIAAEAATKMGIPKEQIPIAIADPSDVFSEVSLDNADHIQLITWEIVANQPDLVIIDSLGAAHSRDENSATKMTPLLKKLASLARNRDVAILAIHHINKGDPKDTSGELTLNRIRGSNTIAYHARTIMALDHPTRWPEGTNRFHLLKSNLSKKPDPLAYQIEEDGVHFVAAPAPDALGGGFTPTREVGRVTEAVNWLEDFLSSGPKPSALVLEAASKAGFPEITVRRAKDRSGHIASRKTKDGWVWEIGEETIAS